MSEAVNFPFAGIDLTLKIAIYLRLKSFRNKRKTSLASPSFGFNQNNIMAKTVCCIMLCSMVFSHLGPRASFNSFP